MGTQNGKTKDEISAFYQKEAERIKKQYGAKREELDSRRRRARSEAEANYTLLQKYLPIANKANGLHGLGVSESTVIAAKNGHESNLKEIEHAYKKERADQKEELAGELAALAREERGELAEAEAALAKKESNDALNKTNEEKVEATKQKEAFDRFLGILRTGTFYSVEDLDRLLAKAKTDVSDDQYAYLEYYVAYLKNHPGYFPKE